MKVPGRAWLEFEVCKAERPNTSTIRQTAEFDPVGLLGLAYWYALYPLHQVVFAGMLRNIARAARNTARTMRADSSCEQPSTEAKSENDVIENDPRRAEI